MLTKAKHRFTSLFKPAKGKKDIFENFYFGTEQSQLTIFDDFLPNLIGSWRGFEIGVYLKTCLNSNLICLLNFYDRENSNVDDKFSNHKESFVRKYNLHHDSIIPINKEGGININTKHAYCLFFNNLYTVYPLLKKFQIPFSFTLYPGGGFKLYDSVCEKFLVEINSSPLFKGVIVTQAGVKNYLINRGLIDAHRINYIYGAPIEVSSYDSVYEKKYYAKNKPTLDICFVSAKYMKYGLDKGFDIFCEVAFRATKKYDFIRFHVVGGFDRNDLLYDVPEDKIFFYGYQDFDWFKKFYSDIDLIISPVKPFVLSAGAFDGFPTAAVMDAGFLGACMLTSDPLGDNYNVGFKNWEDVVLIDSNANSVMEAIDRLILNPTLIEAIAASGRTKLHQLLSPQIQMVERVNILKQHLTNNTHLKDT